MVKKIKYRGENEWGGVGLPNTTCIEKEICPKPDTSDVQKKIVPTQKQKKLPCK